MIYCLLFGPPGVFLLLQIFAPLGSPFAEYSTVSPRFIMAYIDYLEIDHEDQTTIGIFEPLILLTIPNYLRCSSNCFMFGVQFALQRILTYFQQKITVYLLL